MAVNKAGIGGTAAQGNGTVKGAWQVGRVIPGEAAASGPSLHWQQLPCQAPPLAAACHQPASELDVVLHHGNIQLEYEMSLGNSTQLVILQGGQADKGHAAGVFA